MRNSKQPSDCYHLRLPGGPIYLLRRSDGPFKADARPVFHLFSSGHMSDEERSDAALCLTEAWEDCALRFVQEKRYIPRLFISASIFLVTYLFLTLVIRDPLPMLDEVIIALVCAIAAWVLMLRQGSGSAMMLSYRRLCAEAVEALEEEYDEALCQVEAWIEAEAMKGQAALADSLAGLGDGMPPALDIPGYLREAFDDYLGGQGKAYKGYLELLKRSKRPDARLSGILLQASLSDGLDLALLAFLHSFS